MLETILIKKRVLLKAIDYFDIGLSLSSGLVNSLSKYNTGKLENIGLSSNNKDLFINRIMFTIRDNLGNPSRIFWKKSMMIVMHLNI